MDRGWNTVPAAGTRKCNCRYCRAGCFHGNRGLASAQQRQPMPYIIQKKKTDLVPGRKNGALLADPEPCTEPDWAKLQAGRIRAWRQAEKIRAWRQALNKETGQAMSGEQSQGTAGEGAGLAPSPVQEESKDSQDTGLAPSGAQPEEIPTEQPQQELNGDGRDTELSVPGCQAPDNAGDALLPSSPKHGEPESRKATGEQSELRRLERMPLIKKKPAATKRQRSIPTDKTWALEQAARIKAWREAKNREVTQALDSQSVDTQALDSQSGDTQALDSQSGDTQALDSQSGDIQALDSPSVDTQALDSPSVDTQAPDSPSVDTQTPDSQCVDTQAPDNQIVGTQAPDSQIVDTQAPDSQSIDALMADVEHLPLIQAP